MYYAFNGRRRDALALRPNDIIQWQAIREACTRGCRRYDFGEVGDSDRGLAEFKSKWGAEPRRFHRYYFPASRDYRLFFQRDSFARRQMRKIWQRLPLSATALLGEWLYRNL
jgi:lipid II:glycine glycyltransferase (peptidoglycan interpeptide bridge formation enzyme)